MRLPAPRGDDSQGLLRLRIPDYVREQAGHRCVRCHHPFVVGETPGRWSPCDERCAHYGPIRTRRLSSPQLREWEEFILNPRLDGPAGQYLWGDNTDHEGDPDDVEAEWRVLTVHHLTGIKADCRWWNLVALCQRCHFSVQTRVVMDRPWNIEHSDWFKPYVAGFYASTILGEELTRQEVEARLDELLFLERTQEQLDL
jgi:hypothetical protein